MNEHITKVAPETLTVVRHNGVPVITTETLANLYATDEKNIRKNYERNRDRFLCGTHYYKLEGQELKEFLAICEPLRATNSRLQGFAKVRSLMVWTARGACRHAKMLSTDPAWNMYEKLEDAYFNKQEEGSIQNNGLSFKEQTQLDIELRKSIDAHSKTKDPALLNILRQRIIRLCNRLAYDTPSSLVDAQQQELPLENNGGLQ